MISLFKVLKGISQTHYPGFRYDIVVGFVSNGEELCKNTQMLNLAQTI